VQKSIKSKSITRTQTREGIQARALWYWDWVPNAATWGSNSTKHTRCLWFSPAVSII